MYRLIPALIGLRREKKILQFTLRPTLFCAHLEFNSGVIRLMHITVNRLKTQVRVRVTLRLTVSQLVSQSVCLCVEPTLWTIDHIMLPFQVFGSEMCCPVSVGRLLWREAGSVLCKSQSSHLSVCIFTIYIFVFHNFTTHTHTHTRAHIYIASFTFKGHTVA
jgi:hypothetical protein